MPATSRAFPTKLGTLVVKTREVAIFFLVLLDFASDTNVVNCLFKNCFVGVLKDYLRELPEPLFTNALYQMLLDALSVRLPSDPDGSAKLMLSILECLPKANQVQYLV